MKRMINLARKISQGCLTTEDHGAGALAIGPCAVLDAQVLNDHLQGIECLALCISWMRLTCTFEQRGRDPPTAGSLEAVNV